MPVDAAPEPAEHGQVQLWNFSVMPAATPIEMTYLEVFLYEGITPCLGLASADGCSVHTCDTSGAIQSADAGEITASASGASVTSSQSDDESNYVSVAQPVLLFSVGAAVSISAAGDEIPAFSSTIEVPAQITMTSPATPPPGDPSTPRTLVVDRSQPLTLAWTGGGSGVAVVFLLGGDGTTSLSCRFSASAGTATIDANTLGQLPVGNVGQVFVMTWNYEDVVAGDWAIQVANVSNAVWADGGAVGHAATIE
jgi:hypothetical protein